MNSDKGSRANCCGLSLVEILVSTLIFALVMGGLANLFVATKQHILYAHSRIAAAELGRYFLDRLQMDVRQDTWDQAVPGNLLTVPAGTVEGYKSSNNPFTTKFPDSDYTPVAPTNPGFEEFSVNNIVYYPVYEITPWKGLRRVKFIICWRKQSL